MAFIPTTDGVSLTMRYAAGIQFWGTNTVHFRDTSGTPSTARLNELIDFVEEWDGEFNDQNRTSSVSMTRITARDLTDEFSFVVERTVDLPGTQINQAAPPNATKAITLSAGIAGRSFRGRVFQCALSEADVSGKALEQTRLDAIIAAWEGMREGAATLNFVLSVLSLQFNGAPRSSGLLTTVTDIGAKNNRINSMKTRLFN